MPTCPVLTGRPVLSGLCPVFEHLPGLKPGNFDSKIPLKTPNFTPKSLKVALKGIIFEKKIASDGQKLWIFNCEPKISVHFWKIMTKTFYVMLILALLHGSFFRVLQFCIQDFSCYNRHRSSCRKTQFSPLFPKICPIFCPVLF